MDALCEQFPSDARVRKRLCPHWTAHVLVFSVKEVPTDIGSSASLINLDMDIILWCSPILPFLSLRGMCGNVASICPLRLHSKVQVFTSWSEKSSGSISRWDSYLEWAPSSDRQLTSFFKRPTWFPDPGRGERNYNWYQHLHMYVLPPSFLFLWTTDVSETLLATESLECPWKTQLRNQQVLTDLHSQ